MSDRPTSTSTTPVQLVLTIAPDRNGKTTMLVSFRGADGTLTPPREVVLNHRCDAFVASMLTFARAKLVAVESSPEVRAGDGDPTISVEAAEGEQVR
jgi:hypothetical protein